MLNTKTGIYEEKAVISLEGKLDTLTSPELEQVITEVIPQTNELILDLEGLEYTSSAGLRVILSTYKRMNAKNGILRVRNVNPVVMELFEMTELAPILNIE
ncbi:MAG: STAS domain-containing protein [Clostridia bacterium]|nr:STAS domain-containing protein [Clostridia bacterium]MBQ5956824.1 STAS domain-containing protein [Clostridia bacterium]MBQ6003725.1 STAS domain-containing protein [Clostridia bacterium]MBR3563760.1 STAS domain-containing protein [Clostridia bacterium]MBR6135817.1 STAS domain-containing protein [Clostridia bacterium]